MNKFEERITKKGYGFTSVWCAVIAAVCAVGSETARAYVALCMYGGSGCLSKGANDTIGTLGTGFFVVGVVAAILTLLSAVESIAVEEKTKKPYVSLSLMALTITLFYSGLIYFVIYKTALAVFG